MKEKKINILKWILGGFGVVLILALVLSAISFVTSYSSKLSAQAEERANYYMDSAIIAVEEEVNAVINEARSISDEAAEINDIDDVCRFLRQVTMPSADNQHYSEYVKTIRLIKGDSLYTDGNVEYTNISPDFQAIKTLPSDTYSTTFVGIYYDEEFKTNLASIYVPVRNRAIYDGIVIYYLPEAFTKLSVNDQLISEVDDEEAPNYFKLASFLALSKKNSGIVVQNGEIKKSDFIASDNILNELDLKVTSDDKGRLSSLLLSSSVSSVELTINSEQYYMASRQIGKVSNLYLIGMYQSSAMYEEEFTFFRSITALFILFASMFIGTVVVLLIRYFMRRHYNKDEAESVAYRCLTYIGFVNEATKIYQSNQGSKFAIICINIRFFKYILSLNNGMDKRIVLNIRTLLLKMMQERECFGYDASGMFLVMFHFDTMEHLLERLELVDKICKRIKLDSEKRLTLFYGICQCEPSEDVLTTVDHAKEALKTAEKNIGISNYNIYERSSFGEVLDKEFIEMNVERALSRGDFKVFYQPKYNMNKNMIDGAEALIRWYMPEENRFYPPASFLPVIEENGFIAKVDRFVFEQVCIYIRNCLNRGVRLQPISVNVSQNSIAHEDFIDFYTSIKEKYKIRDGMIYIEFTESAYFENTTAFIDIINKLHSKGFLCSIDDFGTGFSSYNSLKQFNMDEIKLDRFFLRKGLNDERDRAVLKSVINLGKELGMKVTTEGVSTTEDYNILKELGCDVMQGFLYAKPMTQADFESFVSSGAKGSFV